MFFPSTTALLRCSLAITFLWFVSSQVRAQAPPLQHHMDDNALAAAVADQARALGSSLNNTDVHLQDRIISGAAFAKELVQLSERVVKIAAEQRPYFVLSNCTIEGDIVLDQKRIAIPVQFNQVVFKGEFSLKGASIETTLNFTNNCEFKQSLTLSQATIHSIQMGFDGKETTFGGAVAADKTVFTGTPSFTKAVFRQPVSFNEAQFKDVAEFDRVSFGAEANFVRTVFSGYTTFSFSSFGQIAHFQYASFEKTTDFSDAVFNNEAHFGEGRFKERADFGAAKFAAAFFARAVFSDSVSFHDAKFKRFVRFTQTRFVGEVDFEGAEFPSIVAPYTEIAEVNYRQPGVDLKDTRFEKRCRLSFQQLLDGPAWQPFRNPRTRIFGSAYDYQTGRVWENLAQVFKNSNDLASQNEAEYQKNLFAAYHPQTNGNQRLISRFNRIFRGYGVRPWRVGFWIFISFVAFAFLYWTQAAQISNHDGWKAHWNRIKFALDFSWRTAYRLF